MGSNTAPRPSARSRGGRAQAILHTTLQALGELGYDQLTIDAVAARAASSKNTIYRRWPDKSALVCAALIGRAAAYRQQPACRRYNSPALP